MNVPTPMSMPARAVGLFSVPYRPPRPKQYDPAIAMIGCGGITKHHLAAYRSMGYRVVALCDVDQQRADARRAAYYPDAQVYTDHKELLRRDDIEVVDITTHPPVRPPIIEAALHAGKHVLSQKPFVTDIDVGQRLVALAEQRNRELAINQNGRWAPHFSYARQAIAAGLLGEVTGVHISVHWNHGWVSGTPFEQVKHLILFDYAIHWFDIVRCFLPEARVRQVFAATARSRTQQVAPHLLAQVSIECDGALASLVFYADTRFGSQDRTYITGSEASIVSIGANEKQQMLTVYLTGGTITPELVGSWFDDGFAGTMGELLCAIEEGRPSTISARDNLRSLELCFAAVSSAEQHLPVEPGRVKALEE